LTHTYDNSCLLDLSTIPLADVVDAFEIFHTGQGTQGIMGTPSKQQLDSVFGTHKDTDVVLQILEKGTLQAASE
jgi:ribosome maturation protein Sdo1